MDEGLSGKYKRLLDILADVAICAEGRLVLVGGSALAIFYLRHRISIDLDFVPLKGDETKAKEALKGCLTKRGYKTIVGRYPNQFVVQFEDASIKIEVFMPEHKIKKINEFEIGPAKLRVASLDDLFQLKMLSYGERKEARDMYDLICILRHEGKKLEPAKELIKRFGPPANEEELRKLVSAEDYAMFEEVIRDAS